MNVYYYHANYWAHEHGKVYHVQQACIVFDETEEAAEAQVLKKYPDADLSRWSCWVCDATVPNLVEVDFD